jgi:hypothetical protein
VLIAYNYNKIFCDIFFLVLRYGKLYSVFYLKNGIYIKASYVVNIVNLYGITYIVVVATKGMRNA